MTDHDAARLAEIRQSIKNSGPRSLFVVTIKGALEAIELLFRALDAAARPHALQVHRSLIGEVTVNPAPDASVPHVPTGSFSEHTITSPARPHDAYEGKSVLEIVAERNASRRRAEAAERERDRARQALREPWGVMLGRAECAEVRVAELAHLLGGNGRVAEHIWMEEPADGDTASSD